MNVLLESSPHRTHDKSNKLSAYSSKSTTALNERLQRSSNATKSQKSVRFVAEIAMRLILLTSLFAICFHAHARAQLLACFPFDDGSLTDASGNGVVATNNGATAVPDGHDGWAYRFDGGNGIRLDLDIQPWRDTMPVVTIGCWAKLESTPGGVYTVISADDGGWDRTIAADFRNNDPKDDVFR